MIRARKGGLFPSLVSAYVERKVRSSFRGVWVRGSLPFPPPPLLLYANHTSFWDGFIGHVLCRAAGWDGYCLMEERNLARYRFLSRIGAFSIRRSDPRSTAASFGYTRALLRQPRAAVLVFPEGEMRPFGARNLTLARGVEVLARWAGVACLPIALRYVVLEDERPDVLIEVGESHAPLPLAGYAANLGALVRRLADTRTLEGFVPLVRGRRSVADRWDAVRGLEARI